MAQLLGMGNPLLDISAVVPQEVLDKYKITLNNAILAEEEHMPIYQDLKDNYAVEFIAGGATQNSLRVAQWMAQKPGACSYIGCVGKDENAAQMAAVCKKDGLSVHYMEDPDTPTGTCAVCVKDGERSLVTALGAANNYNIDHVKQPENWAVVEAAQFYYISGFFITVSSDTILEVARHAAGASKTFCMNLSAPFIMQVPPFKAALTQAMPYVDFLFGNETEAVTFAESEGWETRDVEEIAKKASQLPKEGGRPRTVVFTQGADATVVACEGEATKHAVIPLAKEDLVDTNGAGDAFVGGFLSQLVHGKDVAECCRAGNYCANLVIQRSGCTYPDKPNYQ
jgi:adenosine kinase